MRVGSRNGVLTSRCPCGREILFGKHQCVACELRDVANDRRLREFNRWSAEQARKHEVGDDN